MYDFITDWLPRKCSVDSEGLLEDAVEVRWQELAAERRSMRQSFDRAQDRQIEQREGAQAAKGLTTCRQGVLIC